MKLTELSIKDLLALSGAISAELGRRLIDAELRAENVERAIEYCQETCMTGDYCAQEIIDNLLEQRAQRDTEIKLAGAWTGTCPVCQKPFAEEPILCEQCGLTVCVDCIDRTDPRDAAEYPEFIPHGDKTWCIRCANKNDKEN